MWKLWNVKQNKNYEYSFIFNCQKSSFVLNNEITFDLWFKQSSFIVFDVFWPNIIVIFSDRHTLHPLSYSRSHCWWSSENLSTINLKRDSFWKQQMVKVQLIWWWSSLSSMRKKNTPTRNRKEMEQFVWEISRNFFFPKKTHYFFIEIFFIF